MKENIYFHNLRLNLDVQEQLDIHGYLMNYDKKKYKSKNVYIMDLLKAGIEKLHGDTELSFLSEQQLKAMEDRITERIRKDVLNEVLKTLLNMSARPSVVPVYREQNEEQVETQEERINTGMATAALGFFEE